MSNFLSTLTKEQKHNRESDLVAKHKRLVISLAYNFAKQSRNFNDLDDYTQVGYIGLLKAIRNYKGINSLVTMAWKYINWEILNYIAKNNKLYKCEFNNNDFIFSDKNPQNFDDYLPSLSQDESNILHLRISGYTFIEIGTVIGYSRYNARNRYMSVLNKIQSTK